MNDRKYELLFDDFILKQMKKLGKERDFKRLLLKMMRKIETMDPLAGKLLDSQLALFEVKAKRPPIRLYYKNMEVTKQAYLFEFEIKTSSARQQQTIEKIRKKIRSESQVFSSVFFSFGNVFFKF